MTPHPNRARKEAANDPNHDREEVADNPHGKEAANNPNHDRKGVADNPNHDREGVAGAPGDRPLPHGRGSASEPLPHGRGSVSGPLPHGRGSDGCEHGAGNWPLAYLITFPTYGTWLHGDTRGSVDRDHNIPGTPMVIGAETGPTSARKRDPPGS